jgi:hypothetical protein
LTAVNNFSTGTNTSPIFLDKAAGQHNFTIAQYRPFGNALYKYVTALNTARIQEAAGATPTWPSNNVSVTG